MVLRIKARAVVVLLAVLSFVSLGLVAGSAAQAAARSALPVAGSEEWWFTSWQVEKIWAAGARGQGVIVAVIDSGVDASRPELKGRVLPGTDPAGGNSQTDTDERGHGTAMARFIVGQGGWGSVGVAPEAKILPINWGSTSAHFSENIRYAADHGAKIINMSVYGSGGCDAEDPELSSAVRYAIDRGAILFAGSGNDGRALDNYPADCPGVVSVAAVDARARVWSGSTSSGSVALAAPGTQMPSLYSTGRRGISEGTSDATALTSGAAALVWSRFPELTNRQVVARLLATARDIGPRGRDASSGFGIVRPLDAITENVPADAPNPVFDELDQVLPSTGPAVASEQATPLPAGPVTGSARAGGGAAQTGDRAGGFPVLVLVAGVVVLAAIVVLAVVLLRRRPGPPGPPPPGDQWPGHPAGQRPVQTGDQWPAGPVTRFRRRSH